MPLTINFSINTVKIILLNMDGAAAQMYSTLSILDVLKIENAVTDPMETAFSNI